MSRVLIIDSVPQMRNALRQFFSTHGMTSTAVAHGVDAARSMRRETPDLILIDQDVPLGGLKTAQIIRLNPRYNHVPILLGLQAGSKRQIQKLVKEGMDAGLSGMVLRPYEPGQLLEKVRYCLSSTARRAQTGQKEGKGKQSSSMEIRNRIRELTDLPTLSPAQQRVISIMSRDDADVDMEALVVAIQSDHALTMRTMRIARSAYYGFTGSFIRTAITFLGMARLRQIVQSATILEVFDQHTEKGGLNRKAFWEHSVACGLVMQHLSRDNRHARHFTGGLLHDVGKLVLDFKFPEYSRAIVEIASVEKRPMDEIERELIGITHQEIGQELCRLWQLPNEIAESIAHHHAPSRAYRHKYLSSLIYLSDIAVRQMGIGNGGNEAEPVVEDPYAQKLHLSPQSVLLQQDDLVREVEAIVSPDPD